MHGQPHFNHARCRRMTLRYLLAVPLLVAAYVLAVLAEMRARGEKV